MEDQLFVPLFDSLNVFGRTILPDNIVAQPSDSQIIFASERIGTQLNLVEERRIYWYQWTSYGGVPERPNGTVSKTVVGETPPRVRIPAPPPIFCC